MKTCIKCGSHAFNLYAEEIDQGGFCDVHYWQGRAHRAEAQPPLPVQPEQERVAPTCERCADEIVENNAGLCANCLPAICTEQEPVAWTPGPNLFKDWCSQYFGPDSDDDYLAKAVFNLPPMAQRFANTTPPKRPWVGLTDAEMQALWDRYAHMEMMRAIEAKLKEKNT